MKTIHSLGAVCVLCVAAIGCGAAPEGAETGNSLNEEEGTTAVPGSTIEQKLCDNGPCGGGGGPPPPTSIPSDKFRVHLSGIWFVQSCDSGWDGVTGAAGNEAYWTIAGTGHTQVTIDQRSADNYASIAGGEYQGLHLNVTKEIWAPRGTALTMYGSAWDWDAWFEGGDDWLGHWTRQISWNNLPANGQPAAFTDWGGNDYCGWLLDYEVSRVF